MPKHNNVVRGNVEQGITVRALQIEIYLSTFIFVIDQFGLFR